MQDFQQTDKSLPSSQRIKSKKLFDDLFEGGKSLWLPPIRLQWMEIPFSADNPVLFGVSVPKRRMRKSSDRNRMKRLVREAYRLNKTEVIEMAQQGQKGYAILFIAQCSAPLKFIDTQDKIILLLQRLIRLHAPAVE